MALKDGKQSDSWQHSTVAQVHAQDGVEVLNTNHIAGTQNHENDHFQEEQAKLVSDSPPSEGSEISVLGTKVDSEFGDSKDNLLACETAAPVDLDQAQIHKQSAFPKPFQVPLVLLFPAMPVDNCGKLPPVVHEVPDELDNSPMSVIVANAKKTTSSDVTAHLRYRRQAHLTVPCSITFYLVTLQRVTLCLLLHQKHFLILYLPRIVVGPNKSLPIQLIIPNLQTT